MTDIFYLDSKILSDEISKYSVSSRYSEIRIGTQTVRERIENLLPHRDLRYIEDISELEQDSTSDEILIFSTSVFAKDLDALEKFLRFAGFSMINSFWGHKNCFIYKGHKSRFIDYLKDLNKRDIYFVRFPGFILDLTSLPELKTLLSNSHDSRHFNDIQSIGDHYVKKSLESKKLKSEFEFLRHVPDHLQRYFVEVFEFNQEGDLAQYSMVSYDYKDVSHLYLSNSLDEESFRILLSLVQKYFDDSKKHIDLPYEKNSFDELLEKNSARLEQLKKIEYFGSLDAFLQNFKGISVQDHHQRVQKELLKREKSYRKEEYIFSHGDLCFSNILFSPQNAEIKLIDPKGYENQGMRSPYYDMAKLSHSILGNYDLIINHMAEIAFDDDMHASLDFKQFDYLKAHYPLFLNMVSRMHLDMTLVRLVEASLFLSMIPFHYENKRKAFMLCMRSVEIFEELDL